MDIQHIYFKKLIKSMDNFDKVVLFFLLKSIIPQKLRWVKKIQNNNTF